jgi:hypothetical protein
MYRWNARSTDYGVLCGRIKLGSNENLQLNNFSVAYLFPSHIPMHSDTYAAVTLELMWR